MARSQSELLVRELAMQRTSKILATVGGAITAIAAAVVVPGQLARSADHLDPPARTDPAVDSTPDIPADIADIYAFADANFVYFIDTVGGPAAPTLPAFYDRDVLYTINVSTAPPATSSELSFRFRFGPGAGAGEWGIAVENLPGVNGSIVGSVEQILSKDGVKVYAGLRDDPFFFDSQGLKESRAMGTIRFDKTRNFFGAKNITTIAIAIPRSRFPASGQMDIWTASARFGGQL
jgi:hypothetical protein